MANPKRRHSRSRRDKRRANWKVETPTIINCPNCGTKTIPHIICPSCGFYKGKIFLNNSKPVNEQKQINES